MPAYTNKLVYDALKELNLIDSTKLDLLFKNVEEQKLDIVDELSREDLLSEEHLGNLISTICGFPYVKLTRHYIPENILHIIPEAFANKYNVIAFRERAGGIDIATNEPTNTEIIEHIKKKANSSVGVFYAMEQDIQEALILYRQNFQSAFNGIFAKTTSENLSVDDILNAVLEYAYDSKASDIHIEPTEDHAIVRFRIDGMLKDIVKLPLPTHAQLLNKIKVESKLRTDEHHSSQDGKMKYKTKNEVLDIRISIVPLIKGEDCVMRLLTSHVRQYGLNDLGMTDRDINLVTKSYKKPYGMILSTGPTGSGKTTSMYAIIKELNTRNRNITTIEDPVEYDILGINQIQVNPKTNLTFAEGLRSILRQDPDTIFVGEIRDEETANIAVNSAMTGHLVLSTLHTNDASTALPRLTDMAVEPFLISTTVNIIIAQRLVRKICDNCKVSYTKPFKELSETIADPTTLKLLKKHKADDDITLYKGKGCPVCGNVGYTGRVGLFEVLEVNDPIRKLINSKASSSEINKEAIKNGMTTMLEDGLLKVLNGITTLEEVFRVTKE